MTRKSRTGAISDLGEKIGGARKDRAVKTGPRSSMPKAVDPRPAWARRYAVNEIVASHNPSEVGQWSLVDTQQKDWRGQAKRIKTFATEAAARDAVPLIAVSRNHTARSVNVAPAGSPPDYRYEIWRKVTDRKNVRVVNEQFASRDAAFMHMAANAQAIIETKTGFGEEILAKPEIAKRVGPDVRSMSDIAGESFMKTLGMRGVEFGNWQGDRQHVMNHAYDAFQDLAHVTGIDPKSLSLNSELGIAFGARGNGLSSARAHYERDYAAINLTKMEGAGALAHEWFHGLDHMLGRVDEPKLAQRVERSGDKVLNTLGRDQDFGSHRVTGYRAGQMPDAVRAAYKGLIDTLYHREEQFTEDAAKVEKFSAATATEVDQHIKRVRDHLAKPYEYSKKGKPATEAQLKKFDDLVAKVKAEPVKWSTIQTGKGQYGAAFRYSNPALEELSKLHKEVRGRTGFDSQHKRGSLDELAKAVVRHQDRVKRVEESAAQTVKTRKIPTEFAREAHKLDEGRVTDYWQTKHEMAARAFSAYVEDKLAAQNRQSDYLSFGSDNKHYRMMGMKPFPEGPERQAINQKFDALFEAMKAADVVKPYTGPRHVWDDKARTASAEVRAANAETVEKPKAGKGAKKAPNPPKAAAPAQLPTFSKVAPPEHVLARAAELGARSFEQGLGSAPALNKELNDLMFKGEGQAFDKTKIMDAYTRSWMKANIAAPVEGVTDAASMAKAKADSDARLLKIMEGTNAKIAAERQRIADGTKKIGDTHVPKAPAPEIPGKAFTEGMDAKNAFRAKATLDMHVRVNGKGTISRKALVEKRVAAGAKVEGDRLVNPDGTFLQEKAITKTGLKYAEHLAKGGAMKLGIAAMIAAPVTAAMVAYDATKSKASAEGRSAKAVTLEAGKAAAIAGVATGTAGIAIIKGLELLVKGAALVGPVAGKVAARAVPGLGIAAMAYGAYEGFKAHGVKGAALGLVGADGLLDIGKSQPKADFHKVNELYRGMQKANEPTGAPRGFANAKIQAAAQAAKGRYFHGFHAR